MVMAGVFIILNAVAELYTQLNEPNSSKCNEINRKHKFGKIENKETIEEIIKPKADSLQRLIKW